MKAKNPVEVLDLYEWLPGYGETSVELITHGRDLKLSISYDGETDTLLSRVLTFHGVCGFNWSASPGVDTSNIEYDKSQNSHYVFGSLIEYTDSDAAKAWVAHFGRYLRVVKHYSVGFLAENYMLRVFAESFSLSDAVIENNKA